VPFNYPVGDTPVSVTTADVNGDGNVDIICANFADDTLTVLTNNGSGGFAVSGTYAVGYLPMSVTAADVNGDGKVALISANFGDDTLTVLTNDGSGGFAASGTYAVGSGPTSVTAADVNGDGKVALISANSLTNTLTMLTNDGSGGFATAGTYAANSGPRCVVAADVNGDGKVDLISADFTTNTLSVLTNDGHGSFALVGNYVVGDYETFPWSVVAADVNGDGKVDLISASPIAGDLGGTITVLTNDGSGGFAFAGAYSQDYGPRALVAADVNGDGKIDLFCGDTSYPPVLTVWTNDGSGGFALAYTYFNTPSMSVTAADVNKDGKMDLIFADQIDSLVVVLINTSTFPAPTLTVKQSGNSVIVSWPSLWTGWTLQQNSCLATTNWSACSGVSDNGTNKSLTITPPTGNLFFRLAKPVN
jgi:hypothetical protein